MVEIGRCVSGGLHGGMSWLMLVDLFDGREVALVRECEGGLKRQVRRSAAASIL